MPKSGGPLSFDEHDESNDDEHTAQMSTIEFCFTKYTKYTQYDEEKGKERKHIQASAAPRRTPPPHLHAARLHRTGTSQLQLSSQRALLSSQRALGAFARLVLQQQSLGA